MDTTLDDYDWDGDAADLADVLGPIYAELFGMAYTGANSELPVTVSFDLSNPAIKRVLAQLAQQVTGISETTRAAIQALVDQATEQGWSVDKLALAIRNAGVTESAARAATIARTETARGFTQGSLLAYADSGVVAATTWLSSDGCDICAPLNETQAALGETFDGGFDGPPAHPNCRCALVPVLTEG